MAEQTYRIWDNDENRWCNSGVGRKFPTFDEAKEWKTSCQDLYYERLTEKRREWLYKNYPNGAYSLYLQLDGEDPAIF